MKASAVPPTTVAWKCPGTRSVSWAMMLICSVPVSDAGDPAHEAEDHQRKKRAREAGIRPGRFPQPLEAPLDEAAQAHAGLHSRRHGETVDHRRQNRQIHGVAGVPDLPGRTEAGIDQEMVGGGHRNEQHVEDERPPADLLVEHHGADRQGAHEIPDRDHGGDVDLLRGVSERPEHQAVDLRVDVHVPQRPEEGRDVDRRAVQQGDDGDDRRGERAEGDQRQRAGVALFSFGDDERGEEEERCDERADREEDDSQIVERMRLERHVPGEEHVRPAPEHDDVDQQRADEHESEAGPGELGCRLPRPEYDRSSEVEDRHLEEDDEEDQHVEAVQGQDAVVPGRLEQMHRLPAGERQEQGRDDADEQEDDPDDGVPAHQKLGVAIDPQAGHRTEARGEAPERRVGGCGAGSAGAGGKICRGIHRVVSWIACGVTCGLACATCFAGRTTMRPSMLWWLTPQNSLQTMRYSPGLLGLMERP